MSNKKAKLYPELYDEQLDYTKNIANMLKQLLGMYMKRDMFVVMSAYNTDDMRKIDRAGNELNVSVLKICRIKCDVLSLRKKKKFKKRNDIKTIIKTYNKEIERLEDVIRTQEEILESYNKRDFFYLDKNKDPALLKKYAELELRVCGRIKLYAESKYENHKDFLNTMRKKNIDGAVSSIKDEKKNIEILIDSAMDSFRDNRTKSIFRDCNDILVRLREKLALYELHFTMIYAIDGFRKLSKIMGKSSNPINKLVEYNSSIIKPLDDKRKQICAELGEKVDGWNSLNNEWDSAFKEVESTPLIVDISGVYAAWDKIEADFLNIYSVYRSLKNLGGSDESANIEEYKSEINENKEQYRRELRYNIDKFNRINQVSNDVQILSDKQIKHRLLDSIEYPSENCPARLAIDIIKKIELLHLELHKLNLKKIHIFPYTPSGILLNGIIEHESNKNEQPYNDKTNRARIIADLITREHGVFDDTEAEIEGDIKRYCLLRRDAIGLIEDKEIRNALHNVAKCQDVYLEMIKLEAEEILRFDKIRDIEIEMDNQMGVAIKLIGETTEAERKLVNEMLPKSSVNVNILNELSTNISYTNNASSSFTTNASRMHKAYKKVKSIASFRNYYRK